MLKLIKKIVGTQNDRELKRLWPSYARSMSSKKPLPAVG
jgi:hypothetical protein